MHYHERRGSENLLTLSQRGLTPFLGGQLDYGSGMSSQADPTPIAAGTSEPSAQEVVQSFIAALERLDFDGAFALAAPDIQWINVPWKTATNKERFEKMLLGMFKETTRFEVEFFDIHERGDGVVYTDRLDIIEGGGMSMRLPVQGEFRVRDGLVTEWVDRFSWAKAIGDIGRSLPGIIKHRLGR
jgi:limonene-1,2-epoxide hydrolase